MVTPTNNSSSPTPNIDGDTESINPTYTAICWWCRDDEEIKFSCSRTGRWTVNKEQNAKRKEEGKSIFVVSGCRHPCCADCLTQFLEHSSKANRDSSCPVCRNPTWLYDDQKYTYYPVPPQNSPIPGLLIIEAAFALSLGGIVTLGSMLTTTEDEESQSLRQGFYATLITGGAMMLPTLAFQPLATFFNRSRHLNLTQKLKECVRDFFAPS